MYQYYLFSAEKNLREALPHDGLLELWNWGGCIHLCKNDKDNTIRQDYQNQRQIHFQGLLVVYLVVVVVMVKRQIRIVDDDDEEEEDYNNEEIVIMTDQKGATDAKPIENIVLKQNEIFLWFRNIQPSNCFTLCSCLWWLLIIKTLNITLTYRKYIHISTWHFVKCLNCELSLARFKVSRVA